MNEDRPIDDELITGVSQPPDYPAATREQVERTWQAIVEQVETIASQAGAPVDVVESCGGRPDARIGDDAGGWRRIRRLFAPAPAASWTWARAAVVIVAGFVGAWLATGQGWLPAIGRTPETPVVGTAPTDTTVPAGTSAPADSETPDRSWLAANDHSGRIEALLLGLSHAMDAGAGDVAPVAREVGRELLSDNRFYRRVAERNGDRSLTELLSRIELLLLALATAPQGQEDEVVNHLKDFIGETELLSEIRDLRASVPSLPKRPLTTTSS